MNLFPIFNLAAASAPQQLFVISICISYKHLKFSISKTKLITYPPQCLKPILALLYYSLPLANKTLSFFVILDIFCLFSYIPLLKSCRFPFINPSNVFTPFHHCISNYCHVSVSTFVPSNISKLILFSYFLFSYFKVQIY